jgi:hypothetical protein
MRIAMMIVGDNTFDMVTTWIQELQLRGFSFRLIRSLKILPNDWQSRKCGRGGSCQNAHSKPRKVKEISRESCDHYNLKTRSQFPWKQKENEFWHKSPNITQTGLPTKVALGFQGLRSYISSIFFIAKRGFAHPPAP